MRRSADTLASLSIVAISAGFGVQAGGVGRGVLRVERGQRNVRSTVGRQAMLSAAQTHTTASSVAQQVMNVPRHPQFALNLPKSFMQLSGGCAWWREVCVASCIVGNGSSRQGCQCNKKRPTHLEPM